MKFEVRKTVKLDRMKIRKSKITIKSPSGKLMPQINDKKKPPSTPVNKQ